MSILQVNLPGQLSEEVANLVASGRYKSLDEVLVTAVHHLVNHERVTQESQLPQPLTAQIAWSDSQCCAFCPELDLATAMPTEEEAVADLAEMAVEYAADYLDDIAFYANSPDRGQHLPLILTIAKYTTDVYDEEGVKKVRDLFQRR
jgi:Arc/MetJ-type ribon-helix-helix transcriptional regulator